MFVVQACRPAGYYCGVVCYCEWFCSFCLLSKGVYQGALFFVVFRVWLFEDFEGSGILFLGRGRQNSSGASLAACL